MRRRSIAPTWPQIVRAIAAATAVYGVSPLCASQDKAAVLAFAGSLIVASLTAGPQEKRNRKRGLNGNGAGE